MVSPKRLRSRSIAPHISCRLLARVHRVNAGRRSFDRRVTRTARGAAQAGFRVSSITSGRQRVREDRFDPHTTRSANDRSLRRIEDMRHGADNIRFGSKEALLIDSEPSGGCTWRGKRKLASPRKNAPLARKCRRDALGSPVFHCYLPPYVAFRALGRGRSQLQSMK